VSSGADLGAILRREVLRRQAEDESRFEAMSAQLERWREERQLETAVLLEALKELGRED
jgi:hypothetical protein